MLASSASVFRFAAKFSPQCVLAAAMLVAGDALADELRESLQGCVSIADPERRLGCFDAAVKAGVTAPAAVGAAVVATDPIAATGKASAASAEDGLFQVRERPPPGILEATVAAVTKNLSGDHVIAFDNGQVWKQVTSTGNLVIKPGDRVTVRPGALGSYTLVGPRGVATKVRRLR